MVLVYILPGTLGTLVFFPGSLKRSYFKLQKIHKKDGNHIVAKSVESLLVLAISKQMMMKNYLKAFEKF